MTPRRKDLGVLRGFLSCAHVERGAVVHTTVDVSLQEAWAKTPNGKKRETTHVVRCETEIFRIKS